MNTKSRTSNLTRAAAVAAIYVILTYVSYMFGASSVLRLGEILTALPVVMAEAVPGLFIGCFLANMLTGEAVWTAAAGAAATLLGAIGTRKLRKKSPFVAMLPPVIANTVIIPFVLMYAYGAEEGYPLLALSVGAGEFLNCEILGGLFAKAIGKRKELFEKGSR